jgi:acetyl-CoA carboxylase biotin carboxyl carrier protein
VELKEIEDLIALMRRAGVTQLSLEVPDYKISITRGSEGERVTTRHAQDAGESRAHPSADGSPGPPEAEPELTEAVPVVSPVVGVFHNGGMVGPREIVKEGDRVRKGQLLAAIEAMKVPNELRAPIGGVIAKLLVKDGAAVEYGQTLFLMQPEEAGESDEVESAVGLA